MSKKGKSKPVPKMSAEQFAAQNKANSDAIQSTDLHGGSQTSKPSSSEVNEAETSPGNTDNLPAQAAGISDIHPNAGEMAADLNAAKPEADIGDIGKNAKTKRGPSGPRTGDAMGAKPRVRQLMGTMVYPTAEDAASNKNGVYPSFTVEELCTQTKKSDVNIRTILSDLRSPKYCGQGGVFMTVSYKKDGKVYYTFGTPPAPAEPAKAAETPQPAAAPTA